MYRVFPAIFISSILFISACESESEKSGSGTDGASNNRPNIVLIISDDHGTDALGSYGNPYIKTPNLDNLANEGTRFAFAYATTASCSPSRSVILSGLHNHFNGMYGLAHHPHNFSSFTDIQSLPNILAENGYRTARIGKFHVAPESVYQFQEVLSAGVANDPATIGRSPVEMAEIASDFINNGSEEPFFLLYATDDPHRANVYTPEGQLTFDTYPEPNPFGNKKGGFPGVNEVSYSTDEVMVPPYLPDNEYTRAELAQYYQSVSRVDQGIGRLNEILVDGGFYDNTLIIYVSDNGPAFPASKTTLYEPGIHLPLIVKAPEHRNKGMVQNGMASLVDITPTILDFAEVPTDDYSFHGRSFRELTETENVSGWDEVYGSHTMHGINMYYPMRMVRDRQYKLIYNIAYELPFSLALDLIQAPSWISVLESDDFGNRSKNAFFYRDNYELYDLEADPGELNNLVDSPEHQEILQSMKKKIEDFQIRTNDPRLRLPVIHYPSPHRREKADHQP